MNDIHPHLQAFVPYQSATINIVLIIMGLFSLQLRTPRECHVGLYPIGQALLPPSDPNTGIKLSLIALRKEASSVFLRIIRTQILSKSGRILFT